MPRRKKKSASPADALALHSARDVAFGQRVDFCLGDEVQVARDGVLQRRGRGGKFDRFLAVLAGEQRVDQSSSERISRSDSIDDGDVVVAAEGVALAVDEQAAPTVFARALALAQRDGDLLDVREAGERLPRDVEVT